MQLMYVHCISIGCSVGLLNACVLNMYLYLLSK